MKFSRNLATWLPVLLCLTWQTSHASPDGKLVRLNTSTTLISSGLMDKLKPAFEAATGHFLQVESFGTGRALRNAIEGQVDVVIAHAPETEEKFMQSGYGLTRRALMKNTFILAGPANDPAGVAHSPNVISAFTTLATSQARFISRGDDSGTHKKELAIWQLTGIEPQGKWYIEYGHGMGKTLLYANQANAYVLVDKGTWLANLELLTLANLYSDDERLDNPYHVITINPQNHPSINTRGAQIFLEWISSDQGQGIIRNFTVNGEPLFTPAR